MKYDIFISHASEDKISFVRPLAHKLRKYGLRIWYDELNLTTGDSLKESIEKAIKDSNYGLVILSKDFFRKKWTKIELNTLFSKELLTNKKTIVPIWLNLTVEEIYNFSPFMADKLAISVKSEEDIDYTVNKILKLVFPSKYSTEEIITKINNLRDTNKRNRLKVLSDEISLRISKLTNLSNELTKRIIYTDEDWNDELVSDIYYETYNFYKVPQGVSCDNGGGLIDNKTEKYWKKQLSKWIKGKLSEDECWGIFNDFFMFRDFDYKYIFYGIEGEYIPLEPSEEFYQKMIVEIGSRNFT